MPVLLDALVVLDNSAQSLNLTAFKSLWQADTIESAVAATHLTGLNALFKSRYITNFCEGNSHVCLPCGESTGV
jgi:hypothetical protein